MWIIFKALSLDENLKIVSTDRNKNPCHGPSALECQEVREMRRDHQRRMGGAVQERRKPGIVVSWKPHGEYVSRRGIISCVKCY